MNLAPGTRIGPYEIVSVVGAGGMGEVYRAHDARLGRDVALKILPTVFAAEPDRIARFDREARTLASLNHPHIGAIYGLEETNGLRALALEFVDGETLADRIARGPIPLEETLPFARQIADALEAAHEQGIIHRDLKPANIKITQDGVVKVLDFGLAKLADAPSGVSKPASPSVSPTITSPALMTQAGMLLGTAAYMAPEQAKGRPADKRSDIWAFGCVLFEMLAARRPFDGEEITETLAAVLRADVQWELVPPPTPQSVRRLLKRCLEKDPKRRLQHIGDARLELDESDELSLPIAAARRSGRPAWRLIASAVTAAAISGVAVWLLIPRAPQIPLTRFTIPVPAGASLSSTQAATVALSPDGRTLVLSSPRRGLLKRRLDGQDFEPVQGAENGSAPFFSPDSKWIGFRQGGKLQKVPVAGGIATTICDAADTGTAAWGENGSIIVSRGGDLFVVPEGGGPLELFLKADDSGPLVQPSFLPGSQVLLARSGVAPGRIVAIEVDRRVRHPLVEGTNPQVAASGELLFVRSGNIWAIRFDPKRLAVSGDPVIVAEALGSSLGQDPLRTRSLFATSVDGTLAFVKSNPEANRSLVWLDRTGTAVPALPVRGAFQSPRLSPNGKRVAVSISSEWSLDLWTYEIESGRRVRLTTQWNNRRNVWSPDGSLIAFYSTPGGWADQEMYVVASTGGERQLLLARPGAQFPASWSPDGRTILFDDGATGMAGSTRDVWKLTLGGAAEPLVASRFYERGAVFSPDGKWIAFVTDESGRAEVYIQPFPGPGGKIPVSATGGLQPMWSRDGRELYFRDGDSLMAVSVGLNPLHIGTPRKLFNMPESAYNLDPNFADYDVSPDGRFIAIQEEQDTEDQIHVVLGWVEELKRLLPTR